MVDGLPIPLAALLPAVMLLLGRLDVLDHRDALWASVAVAIGQLVGVGAFAGGSVSRRGGLSGRTRVRRRSSESPSSASRWRSVTKSRRDEATLLPVDGWGRPTRRVVGSSATTAEGAADD